MGALSQMFKKPKDNQPSRAAPAPVQQDPAILTNIDDTKKKRGTVTAPTMANSNFATASGISI